MKDNLFKVWLISASAIILIGIIFSLIFNNGSNEAINVLKTQDKIPNTAKTNSVNIKEVIPELIIKNLAEKTEKEVEGILGTPSKKENGKAKSNETDTWIQNCPTVYYKNGMVQIKYIENKAARITVNISQKLSYATDTEKALRIVGLPTKEPKTKNENVTVWRDIDGIYDVSIFNQDGTIAFIHAVINEKYE